MADVNRIRELREAREMTQEQLDQKLGTKQQTIGKLENGDRQLSVAWISKMAAALDVTPSEIAPDLGVAEARVDYGAVDLVGYAGAGDLYYPDPERGPWVGIERVPDPPGAIGVVALRVRGSSMDPVYRNGDLLFIRQRDGWDVES